MKITICDVCGTRNEVRPVYFLYDRKMDAAGSMDDVGDTFDLCPKCYLKALKRTIAKVIDEFQIDRMEFNKKMIKAIKSDQMRLRSK